MSKSDSIYQLSKSLEFTNWNMVGIKDIFTDSGNGWSADTKIRFPDDEEFAKVTTRWAAYKPPTYAAAISPATEEDVVKAVRC